MPIPISRRAFSLTGLLATATVFARPVFAQETTLTVGIQSDPVTLDPALMASYFEIAVQFNLHEPLINLKADLTVEPGLADFVRRDALTYDFTLRPDLTFHDGTPIDAQAAKFNIDRMLDPATASPRRSELAPVDRVEVTGPLTFTVRLNTPYAPLLQVLALRAGMLVSPTALRTLGPDFAFKAVGAGPYKVVSWTKNSELVLDRFDGYWRGPAPIERIVFRPVQDDAVRLANLMAGTVQLIDAVPPQAVDTLAGDPTVALRQQPGLGFSAFSFNTRQAPFDKVELRRAFAKAVDPETVLRVAYFGQGTVAAGAIPPTVGWAFDVGLLPQSADPAGAATLLAEAGVALPVPVTITVTNAPLQVRAAEVIQAQAALAGFAVTIQQVDPTSLITVLRKGEFDLCFSPWSGRSDPDGNMFGWFTAKGPQNFSGYDNPEVTQMLQEARAEADQATRATLYRRVQMRISEDAPLLFLVFPETIQASLASLDWDQYPDAAFRLWYSRFR
jgi:peptide/nickel transport system substrate-binding protein